METNAKLLVVPCGNRDWEVYRDGKYLGCITRFDGGTASYGAGVTCYTTSIEPRERSHATLESAIDAFMNRSQNNE